MSEEKNLSPKEMIEKQRLEFRKGKKEEPPKKKRVGNFNFGELSKKYWADVRSGKRKKWTDTKVYDKATKKWIDKKEEPKKEEPKPEIKLEKKTPDKETEEIKKEIKETPIDKIEEIVLSKEEKKEEPKRNKELDLSLPMFGLLGVIVILLVIQIFKRSSGSYAPSTPTIIDTEDDYYEIPQPTGRVIRIKKRKIR